MGDEVFIPNVANVERVQSRQGMACRERDDESVTAQDLIADVGVVDRWPQQGEVDVVAALSERMDLDLLAR